MEKIQNEDHSHIDERIASHFKWTFSTLFDRDDSCRRGLVVIEDDLELSPDFIEYLTLTIPIVEHDDTIIVTSLWNDIGYVFNSNDKHAIRRTNHFPGLGWYLTKHTWDNILKTDWPKREWDWYVREKAYTHKMDTLVPEVPRDYHVASSETYMRESFFNLHFRDINVNRDESFRWNVADVENLLFQDYYVMMKARIKDAHHIKTKAEIVRGADNVISVSGMVNEMTRKSKARCRAFFMVTGIWMDEQRRSDWYGIKIVWYEPTNSYLFIVIDEVRGEAFGDVCDSFKSKTS